MKKLVPTWNSKNKPKIGVLVMSYNASTTITKVLSRIKPNTWRRITEVLIFDDSSLDNTIKVVYKHKLDRHLDKVHIFKNQINLGHGGNQKRGFLYSIKNKFDIIVLLHGDGEYAPEIIDSLIDPIEKGKTDVVLGSRMMVKGQALNDGMPLYKFFGNKFLTSFQNFLIAKRMSEYHSGYRAYKVQALAQIPFLKNSNNFHFDNEIINQFLYGDFKVKEVPIPTYFGGEINILNGLTYAINVIKTTLLYRLHRSGLLYARQFDLRGGQKYSFKQNRYSSHSQILSMLSKVGNGKHWEVLDIGCGAGFLASHVKKLGHNVVGIDIYDSQEARIACKEFYVVDIEKDFGIKKNQKFDCVIMADILEHTKKPEDILFRVRSYLKPDGIIIASSGNVANIYIRLKLLIGQFVYTERGILDNTHCHLFTPTSFKNLFRDCGFHVSKKSFAPIPFELIIPGQSLISNTLCFVNMLAIHAFPSLFGYQTILQAVTDPKVTEFLRYQEINNSQYSEYRR